MNKVNILTIQIRPEIGQREKNFHKVKQLIERNAKLSPDLVVLPEFFNTGVNADEFKRLCEKEDTSQTLAFFGDIAQKYQTYVVAGSIIESDGNKLYNTSWLLDRRGEKVAKYRKIHLFDSFGGSEHLYNTPGNEIIVANTDFGILGMSVCFDIKFPKHYLDLIKRGAEIVVEPTAWIVPNILLENATQDWILMNRVRALDNMVYFVSSNICGKVNNECSSCGNSLIVSPDGKILANAGSKEGVAFAQIDMNFLRQIRAQFCMDKLVK